MNADDVIAIVEEQIAGRWSQTNDHGVDLRASLVPPARIPVILSTVHQGEVRDEILDVWLVLEEMPHTKDGYKIVFDETHMTFGLATQGHPKNKHLVLAGFYGDFWTTFKGM